MPPLIAAEAVEGAVAGGAAGSAAAGGIAAEGAEMGAAEAGVPERAEAQPFDREQFMQDQLQSYSSRQSPRPADPGPEPKAKMPMGKMVLMLMIATVLDGLKALFVCFIFFAPFMVGALAGGVAGSYLGSFVGWVTAAIATTATGVAEILAAPLTLVIELFGIFMAMVVSAIGWLGFRTWFIMLKIDMMTGLRFLITSGGMVWSALPIVDAIPTFTPTVAFVAMDVRREDHKLHAAWQKKANAYQAWQRQQQADRLQVMQAQLALRQADEDEDAIPDGAPA